MTSESKHWNPAHWSDEKVRRYTKHVLLYANLTLGVMEGCYTSALVMAELRAVLAAQFSRLQLKQAGVPVLGDQ